MLRQGSNLVEIAQVLRHSDLATTSGYAKVDRAALRAVAARPWPGAGAVSAASRAAAEYLRLRHALGHELADAARLLPRFAAYLDAIGLRRSPSRPLWPGRSCPAPARAACGRGG